MIIAAVVIYAGLSSVMAGAVINEAPSVDPSALTVMSLFWPLTLCVLAGIWLSETLL